MTTDDWTQYTIRAGTLRARLEEVPDDTPVILMKDAEGNGYSPLSSVDTEDQVYEPDTPWSGEVHDTRDPDYEPGGPAVKVVVLGPMN